MLSFLKFAVLILFFHCSGAVLNVRLFGAQATGQQTHPPQNNAVPTASYVDEPLERLLRIIPETKTLQPVHDQTQLAMILEHSGKNVDTQFTDFGDLVAKEMVSEIRWKFSAEETLTFRVRSVMAASRTEPLSGVSQSFKRSPRSLAAKNL